jgi:hypothetical protein
MVAMFPDLIDQAPDSDLREALFTMCFAALGTLVILTGASVANLAAETFILHDQMLPWIVKWAQLVFAVFACLLPPLYLCDALVRFSLFGLARAAITIHPAPVSALMPFGLLGLEICGLTTML